jgi:hypothetical protein
MSLKRKNELAMLSFLKASGLFNAAPDADGNPQYTVQFLPSQCSQNLTLKPPAIVVVWQELGHIGDSKGRSTGRVRGRWDILVFGPADKVKDAETEPEDDHAAVVALVTRAVQIADLAQQVSAQVAEYTCFYAHARQPLQVQPKANNFLDAFAWETCSCETSCW